MRTLIYGVFLQNAIAIGHHYAHLASCQGGLVASDSLSHLAMDACPIACFGLAFHVDLTVYDLIAIAAGLASV